MFEDGEFDGVEFSDYDVLHNAELDMDDTERDWWLSIDVFSFSSLKIINRVWTYVP